MATADGFWNLNVGSLIGNLITLCGVLIAFWSIRRQQRSDAEKTKEKTELAAEKVNLEHKAAIQELKSIGEARHQENFKTLNSILIQLESVKNIERRVTDVEHEVDEWKRNLWEWVRSKP